MERMTSPCRQHALGLLLTPLRASILVHLSAPRTMSEIARFTFLAKSSATYQVSRLVETGLVTRHRVGNSTVVRRTPIGDTLIDAYDRC